MKNKIFTVLALLILPAVSVWGYSTLEKRDQTERLSQACWSDSAKRSVSNLIHRIAADEITSQYKRFLIANGTIKADGSVPEDSKEHIQKNLSVSPSGFYAKSANWQTGGFECGANVYVSFTDKDGHIFSADERIIEFDVHPGEHGFIFTTMSASVVAMVNEINQKLNSSSK
jgi:hypothetical protein